MLIARSLILAGCAALAGCGGGGSPVAQPTVAAPAFLASAYGDSTQEAQGQPHAASRPGAMVYNRGVSGTSIHQLLAGTDGRNYAWAEMVKRESAPMVIINHGINSRKGDVEAYRTALREAVAVAQAAGLVVMLEQPNAIDEPGFEAFREAMRDTSRQTGVYFCEQPRVTLSDGIHPDAAGRAAKAQRLARCIADLAGLEK